MELGFPRGPHATFVFDTRDAVVMKGELSRSEFFERYPNA
jgi:hypothetical protein